MGSNRTDKLNAEVQRAVSQIINDMNDPRVGRMCSIVKADVSGDLKHAKIYVSVFGSAQQAETAFEAITKAAGFIRRELSSRLNTRYTPELHFTLDDSINYGVRMGKLLSDLNREQ